MTGPAAGQSIEDEWVSFSAGDSARMQMRHKQGTLGTDRTQKLETRGKTEKPDETRYAQK